MDPKSEWLNPTDLDIIQKAEDENRVCVTLDQDFHAHLALRGLYRPSVVRLRVEGLSPKAQADLIAAVLAHCEEALSQGAAVSANIKTIRIRRLPLK